MSIGNKKINVDEVQAATRATKRWAVDSEGWSIKDLMDLSPGTIAVLANTGLCTEAAQGESNDTYFEEQGRPEKYQRL